MVSTLHLMVWRGDWSPFYDVGLTVGRAPGSGILVFGTLPRVPVTLNKGEAVKGSECIKGSLWFNVTPGSGVCSQNLAKTVQGCYTHDW